MTSKFSLSHENYVAVITGCNGQIGAELTKSYISLGARVIGIDLPSTQEKSLELEGFTFIGADISKHELINKKFKEINRDFGVINILINNAGLAFFDHYYYRTERQLDLMMQVNLKGTFNCIRAFELNSNSNALNRSIVNFGSIYGMLSPDFRIYSEGDRRSPEMYGVTKAAVLQMTKYFAVDFASKGIRVNSISPGGVFNSQNPQQTEFIQKYCQRTPMGRMATITEVVDACVFLTSNMASYITGHNLIVDGGYSIL